jgi:hypothetical protein
MKFERLDAVIRSHEKNVKYTDNGRDNDDDDPYQYLDDFLDKTFIADYFIDHATKKEN